MPTFHDSTYRPPAMLRNGHFHTFFASLCRPKITEDAFFLRHELTGAREQIQTPDGDVLDVDCVSGDHQKLLILTHGLEGSSKATYVRRFAQHFFAHGFDIAAWNMRGCGGSPNRLTRSYHSGLSSDLELVVNFFISKKKWPEIFLVGFSVGGNITLKYLGEHPAPPSLKAAAAISTPVDLAASARQLARPFSALYMLYFLRSLRSKALTKKRAGLSVEALPGYLRHRTFEKYDAAFTAPQFGYPSPQAYWEENSSLRVLSEIHVPTLLLSSRDDPFLTAECFPTDAASRNTQLHLHTTTYGGHNGFLFDWTARPSYAEEQVLKFFTKHDCSELRSSGE